MQVDDESRAGGAEMLGPAEGAHRRCSEESPLKGERFCESSEAWAAAHGPTPFDPAVKDHTGAEDAFGVDESLAYSEEDFAAAVGATSFDPVEGTGHDGSGDDGYFSCSSEDWTEAVGANLLDPAEGMGAAGSEESPLKGERLCRSTESPVAADGATPLSLSGKRAPGVGNAPSKRRASKEGENAPDSKRARRGSGVVRGEGSKRVLHKRPASKEGEDAPSSKRARRGSGVVRGEGSKRVLRKRRASKEGEGAPSSKQARGGGGVVGGEGSGRVLRERPAAATVAAASPTGRASDLAESLLSTERRQQSPHGSEETAGRVRSRMGPTYCARALDISPRLRSRCASRTCISNTLICRVRRRLPELALLVCVFPSSQR